jgi:hypothetical protein
MAFKLGDLASKGSRFTPDLSRMYLNAALGERRAEDKSHHTKSWNCKDDIILPDYV